MSHDRTVHAENHAVELVRYDRAGKWYIEPKNKALKRQNVNLTHACRFALDQRLQIHWNLPGGTMFDARCKAWEKP